MYIPPGLKPTARNHYARLVQELGGPPREQWRVMKLAGLAVLEDKHKRGLADPDELTLRQRERRLLGLPQD